MTHPHLHLNFAQPTAHGNIRVDARGYDWPGAEKEFQRAIELNPNVAYIHIGYGWYLMMAGRFDEAMPEMEKAQSLDPRSLTSSLSFGALYYFRRDYDKALDQYRKILEVEPNYSGPYRWMETIYQKKGMYTEAVECSVKELVRVGRLEEAERLKKTFKESGWQGYIRAARVRAEEDAKKEPVSTRTFAVLCALLGEKDQAFAWLNKGVDEHDPFSIWLKIEPHTTLLKRLNMTP